MINRWCETEYGTKPCEKLGLFFCSNKCTCTATESLYLGHFTVKGSKVAQIHKTTCSCWFNVTDYFHLIFNTIWKITFHFWSICLTHWYKVLPRVMFNSKGNKNDTKSNTNTAIKNDQQKQKKSADFPK